MINLFSDSVKNWFLITKEFARIYTYIGHCSLQKPLDLIWYNASNIYSSFKLLLSAYSGYKTNTCI